MQLYMSTVKIATGVAATFLEADLTIDTINLDHFMSVGNVSPTRRKVYI